MKRLLLVMVLAACETKTIAPPADMAMKAVEPDLAPPPWTAISTEAASDFAVNGATIYLATQDGVRRSTDSGASFSQAVALPFAAGEDHAVVLAVDPSNAMVVYAGLQSSGIFKSSDGGATWSAVNTGIDKDAVTNLYTTVLAFAFGNATWSGTTGFLFKTTNGGQMWTRATAISGGYHRGIALDGSNLYVGTIDGVFRSSDSGANFTLSTAPTRMGGVIEVALDGATVLAVTTNGFYRSTDGAATFTRADVGGATFAGNVAGRADVVVARPYTVYLAPSRGVFRSTDATYSFTEVSAQLEGRKVYKLAVDTTDSTLVWALGEDGLFQKRFAQ